MRGIKFVEWRHTESPEQMDDTGAGVGGVGYHF